MIAFSQGRERRDRVCPSPALRARSADMQELTADVGDEAIQLAVQSTVIFVVMLVVLGVGLWYNRRRLATPFAHVVGALERVAAGQDAGGGGGEQAGEVGAHRPRRHPHAAAARASG